MIKCEHKFCSWRSAINECERLAPCSARIIPESEQSALSPVESQSAGSVEFRDLSQEAQTLIVDAAMGVYDDKAPEIPETVKDEIRRWAESEIPQNDQGETEETTGAQINSMPYKKNRLRLKREAISAKRSTQGKYGNEVKRQMMCERADPMEVVGTMKTSGSFGDHLIELIDCGDEEYLWLRVDGEIRRPRTCAGVGRVVKEWIWKKL